MEENFNELENIVEFAYKYKFDCVRFQPLSQLNDSFYNRENVKNSIDKALLKAKEYDIKINNILPIHLSELCQNKIKEEKNNVDNKIEESNHGLFCVNPWQTLIINYCGYIMFDCSCPSDRYVDDINDKSLLDVWNSQNVQMFRKKIKENDVLDICSKSCINYNIQVRE